MSTQFLEIQPKELKFIFELKKHSSCSVRLANNTHSYVAFKVKTTSPKKYCVRPNVGIISPKSSCDFSVTMQAQRTAPPDMACRDKFLIQSTIVPDGTTDENITPSMFAKDGGKYIEENKLRVILVSPPHSPVLSPINGALKQGLAYEASKLKSQFSSRVETKQTVTKDVDESNLVNDEVLSLEKDMEFETVEDAEQSPANDAELRTAKDAEFEPEEDSKLKPAEDVGSNSIKKVEELNLIKDIEEMKSKLDGLESKLREAEGTISKLTEERRSSVQDIKVLQEKLAELSRRGVRRVQVGFPLLFVCMVALISVVVGYLLHL
ncbi:vesicle-associated protein 2-2-like [Alnus glutinosa]|uniref:vesicle-associated protein 2-2-like n=1 Tax=Alnus glutinosa TaxID=3517 RepID=UPI002D7748CB|nr:vesicle-associated protein 2-2-like [Alnus glutinosa]